MFVYNIYALFNKNIGIFEIQYALFQEKCDKCGKVVI